MTKNNNNKETSTPHSRVKKQSNHVLYLFIFTIIALTGGFYFYQKSIAPLEQPLDPSTSGVESTDTLPDGNTPILSEAATEKGSPADRPGEHNNALPQSGINSEMNTSTSQELHSLENQPPHAQSSPENSSTENIDYPSLIVQLNTFYSHLDSQQYMQAFNLSEPSKEHFSKLIQKLIDNPPVVTRETDDLFTLLKNTAHFFRIIGKSNIFILKGILDREKESFETILQSFYQLTYQPKYLKDAFSISLDSDALYDYAGFFLHTMGGRLYLFRRDSNSRMTVSYYSILIIDRANASGDSRHGIDIRPAVDSLIEEIENGGKNLQLRETYLDTLYDLKEKYN